MTKPGQDLRVYITVPGVEDLGSVAVMLRGAGAQATGGRREFVVEGRLTPEQASAVWQLAEHVDSGSESNRLGVRVEPGGELVAALDAMCPDGWNEDSFAWPSDGDLSGIQWWQEQRGLRSQRQRPAAAVPAVSPVAPASAEPVCCGKGGTWAPAGKPRVVGCQLCPESPTYWRTASAMKDMPV